MEFKHALLHTSLLLVALAALDCNAQALEKLLGMSNRSENQIDTGLDGPRGYGNDGGLSLRRIFEQLQTINVPAIYQMNKNGSSMGINVLSGLVKVERGNEAERNGLVGPRPLSVRVFGIPVYERGMRVRPPSSESEPFPGGKVPAAGKDDADEEELPTEP